MPDCDISEMSDVMFGLTSVTNAEIFAHLLLAAYSELDQNDYSIIYSRLQSAKLPTEDYKTLAETHHDLPSTELAKSNYFTPKSGDVTRCVNAVSTLWILSVFPKFAWIININLLIKQCYDNARHLIMLNLQLS